MNANDAAIAQQTAGFSQQPRDSISGQQLQGLVKGYADQLAAIKRDVELRKWAVDQACGLAGAEAGPTVSDPVELARSIHAFLVEGAEKAE